MARLQNVKPIIEMGRGDARRVTFDTDIALIDGHLDRDPTLSICGGEAIVSLTIDSDGGWVNAAQVRVKPLPSQKTLQRVNRLIEGSDRKLKAYHRFGGAVALHDMAAGAYLHLPRTIEFDRRLTGKSMWSVANEGKVARPEPVVAPTAATEAVAEVAAAIPFEMPAPEPEPVIEMKTLPMGESELLVRPVISVEDEVKVKAEVAEGLDMLWSLQRSGKRQVVCLIGPTGTGKTSLVYNLAARQKVGVFNFDCAGAREFSDFVGVTHLRGDQTVFVPSALLEVIRKDGPYAGQYRIVNLDEITRAESAGALNALISMLHDIARINVPEAGRAYDVDPMVMFTMTANRGAQYTGTVGLDLALANRVTAWVRMDYVEEKVERTVIMDRTGISPEDADRLLAAAKRIRDMAERGELPEGGGISTRLVIKAAEKVAAGFSLHGAATWTWVGNYTDEGGTQSESYQVQQAIDLTLR